MGEKLKPIDRFKATPWWLAGFLFATTVLIGIKVGAPIAANFYRQSTAAEMASLFLSMTLTYWYYLALLCTLVAIGYRVVRIGYSRSTQYFYLFLMISLLPISFYGVVVSQFLG